MEATEVQGEPIHHLRKAARTRSQAQREQAKAKMISRYNKVAG